MAIDWEIQLFQLTLRSLCITSICNLSISRFGLEGKIWVRIVPSPANCLQMTFNAMTLMPFKGLRIPIIA